jgi:uncharacterized protein YdhG (YjbR/CyaY superfamily)
MMAPRPEYKDIGEYIAAFPKKVQPILRQVRKTIRKAAPEAKETISYRIPAYMLDGRLIYFAAFEKHISIYPAPRGAAEFKKELAAYKGGKGTVQFPMDMPIPFGLITRIVKFRMKENQARAAAKGKKK